MSEVLPVFAVPFAPGTNCDKETIDAIEMVGGQAVRVPLNELAQGKKIDQMQGMIIPGGFSHGDNFGSGNVFSQRMQHQFPDQVMSFVEQDKPVLGICNGFQVLVRSGLLPGAKLGQQTATLNTNNSNKFEHRWVKLGVEPGNSCLWLPNDIDPVIELPSAHKEGKFVASADVLEQLDENDQIVFRYVDQEGEPTMEHPANPNGSTLAIAGICNRMILGLMPHPERFMTWEQHRNWRRFDNPETEIKPYGRLILGSMVDFVKAA